MQIVHRGYVIAFRHDEEGGYWVNAPDLPDFQGHWPDLATAIVAGQHAIDAYLVGRPLIARRLVDALVGYGEARDAYREARDRIGPDGYTDNPVAERQTLERALSSLYAVVDQIEVNFVFSHQFSLAGSVPGH